MLFLLQAEEPNMRKEVWKMKRKTKRNMLRITGALSLIAALGLSLAGCGGKENGGSNLPGIHGVELQDGTKAEGNKGTEDIRATEGNSETTGNSGGGTGQFYDGADLSGYVVEFSDSGCIITPEMLTVYEDGGRVGEIAVPGYESDDTNITITYTEDTVFQIINFSIVTQKEISREDTDKGSVKKQTTVNIFGTRQDDRHWTADKVVITRWQ